MSETTVRLAPVPDTDPTPADPIEARSAQDATGRKAHAGGQVRDVLTPPSGDQSAHQTPTVEDLRARPEAAGDRKSRLAAAIAAAGGPLAVDTATAAVMCGLGRTTWFRAAAAKKTPAPVRILGKVLYRVEDLRAWMAMGCPPRKEFEARRDAANSGGRPRAGGR